MPKLEVKTKSQVEMIDITSQVDELVKKNGVADGVCYVYVPHTTAAVTINEGADPSVKADILKILNKVIPFNENYSHMEGNSPAHIKASIIGSSQTIFIENGSLQLGRWQSIFFCEFDGPRRRSVAVKILQENG